MYTSSTPRIFSEKPPAYSTCSSTTAETTTSLYNVTVTLITDPNCGERDPAFNTACLVSYRFHRRGRDFSFPLRPSVLLSVFCPPLCSTSVNTFFFFIQLRNNMKLAEQLQHVKLQM